MPTTKPNTNPTTSTDGHGWRSLTHRLTPAQVDHLAAVERLALTTADNPVTRATAAEILDGLTGEARRYADRNPQPGVEDEAAEDLDRFQMAEIVAELARRFTGPDGLRFALAATDPARLTPADRDLMAELVQRSERLELEAMEARRARRDS